MRFQYVLNPALPRLAWYLRMRRNDPDIMVEHGAWVETRAQFFVEGAWDDPHFTDGQFRRAVVCLGSGARIDDEHLTISSPSHTLEKLFLVRENGTLHVSNSFAFLLVRTNDAIDSDYPFYYYDFLSHMRGIGRLCTTTPCRRNRVSLYWYCDIAVEASLHLTWKPKLGPPGFSSYEDHVGFLRAATRRIYANCQAVERVHARYIPLSTISTGYDSPACSVIAKEIGCTETITFPSARSGWKSDADDGGPIARILGLKVHNFDRLDYRTLGNFPEAEFTAAGAGGDEVVFAPAASLLSGKLLFTGFLGDTVWGRSAANVNNFMRMLWPGGSSFGEFRIKAGFVHFPVPMVVYRSHASIVRISNSPAMAPWTTGTDYDRPIPRRLAEEAGVPRHMFGQTKMAVAQSLADIGSIPSLKDVMSDRSHADFVAFTERTSGLKGWRALRFGIGHLAYRLHLRVIWRIDRLAKWLNIAYLALPRMSRRYAEHPSWNIYTFHWGVGKLVERYRERPPSTPNTGSPAR